jgi:sec-independent protein translocase protein TatC
MTAEKHETLLEHLRELRKRLIKSAWAIGLGTCVAYYYSEYIFDFLRAPAVKYLTNGGLVFTHPMDKFMAHLKISVFAGIIGSAPIWLYQAWKFVAPGLYQKEKKYASGFILTGTGLFLTGVTFCYFMVLPAAFEFLFNFGGSVDKPMITITEYIAFVVQMDLMFGLAFELPLVLVILAMMGIISAAFLRKQRRMSWFLLSIVAAVITPTPDALSMFMMLIPLVILFEIAIFFVAKFERKPELV